MFRRFTLCLGVFGLLTGGCYRVDERAVTTPSAGVPSAADTIQEHDDIIGPIDPSVPIVVPNELLSVRWDPSKLEYVATQQPNQLLVHVRNQDEYAAENGGGSLPFVVPGTKKLCYSAIACTRPECARQGKNGRPYLFAFPIKGLTVGENGRLDFAKVDPIDMDMSRIQIAPCPLCKSPAHVKLYVPPEVRKKMRDLEKELADARAAYHKARKSGQPFPTHAHRVPTAILDEMNTLPRLFLQIDPTTLGVVEVVEQSANTTPK